MLPSIENNALEVLHVTLCKNRKSHIHHILNASLVFLKTYGILSILRILVKVSDKRRDNL